MTPWNRGCKLSQHCAAIVVLFCIGACQESSNTSSTVNRPSSAAKEQASRIITKQGGVDQVAADEALAAPLYLDVTEKSGLEFEHRPHLTGNYFMPEIMGAGVALIDYDNDGDLDVYLLQGAAFKGADIDTNGPEADKDRLFKNWWQERGELHFTDVTERAGLDSTGYGMGVAVGDYDQDGYDDLFVTNYGANQLYRNVGDGTFKDVTEEARIHGEAWSSSAAFFDADADGDPDLYVVNYVRFSTSQNFKCTSEGGQLDYCGPQTYQPLPDQFFENLGNGKFRDTTNKVGLQRVYGPGLGLTVSDFNGDGIDDIYVANDGEPNQLWMNSKDSGFSDFGLMSGTALNADGVSEAGMGVMAGDFDNDGDDDLFMTHLIAETNTLYMNDGSGRFYDATNEVNLAANSIAMTGFGAGWLDFDNDGYLDLFVANGNVKLETTRVGLSNYPFEQRNQLFRNEFKDGRHRFKDVSQQAAEIFNRLEVSRGAAFGDLNNDGYVDIVITNNNGPARVLLNNVDTEPWLGVDVVEVNHQTTEGVRVRLIPADSGQPHAWRTVRRSGSYLSAHDPRLRFGLASVPMRHRNDGQEAHKNTHSEPFQSGMTVQVRWLDGAVEQWSALEPNLYHRLQRGKGKPYISSSPLQQKPVSSDSNLIKLDQ